MPQVYEDYWDFTMAWTDFNGEKFLKTLKLVVEFIDEHKDEDYSSELYETLQKRVQSIINISGPSVRKGINELVKLGFIFPFLTGYHSLSKKYLEVTSNEERKLILSKVIYANSSFKRSVTNDSNIREINFIIKTLDHAKCIDQKYLGTLISTNISNYPAGYITMDELEKLYRDENQKEFEKRKYNQIDHLRNLLQKLDGITYTSQKFYLEKDAPNVEIENIRDTELKSRDPYLQRIYKQQLQNESLNIFGKIKCMVEKLEYPVLIASHIKPFRYSNDDEAFDPNNGLLLSKTLDSLFDLNYISFADNGKIIFYSRVPEDVKQFWINYELDSRFLNHERLVYLAYHRNLCEDKNR